MTAERVRQVLVTLADAFPQAFARRSDEQIARTLAISADAVADLPVDVLEQAALHVIRDEEWFPTVAKLREVAGRILWASDDADAALALLMAQWARGVRVPIVNSALALRALAAVGGWKGWGHCELHEARFREAFEQQAARLLTLPEVPHAAIEA